MKKVEGEPESDSAENDHCASYLATPHAQGVTKVTAQMSGMRGGSSRTSCGLHYSEERLGKQAALGHGLA